MSDLGFTHVALPVTDLEASVKFYEKYASLKIQHQRVEAVDKLCAQAKEDDILAKEAEDYGAPVGYWAFIRDPGGHTLEISYGQKIFT